MVFHLLPTLPSFFVPLLAASALGWPECDQPIWSCWFHRYPLAYSSEIPRCSFVTYVVVTGRMLTTTSRSRARKYSVVSVTLFGLSLMPHVQQVSGGPLVDSLGALWRVHATGR